jgi:hypothetical protein
VYSKCWSGQKPHRPEKINRDQHEGVDPKTARQIESVFNSAKRGEPMEKLHEQDRPSKWFGVVRDTSGRPVLEDYGRYNVLSADNTSRLNSDRPQFPQLVSFIGVTNSGKSTLIKLLITLGCSSEQVQGHDGFPSPVIGSIANDSVPTSGDIHLYADPVSSGSKHPIMYIDCEGFEGGEKTPLGSRTHPHSSRSLLEYSNERTEPLKKTHEIKWATTEESRQREYAVTRLYPRILYTFSDCVVFVLRNPKTFQSSVLTKLIDWGAAAFERSLNQPNLPHCIIILNCSDATLDSSQWDSNNATEALLSTVRDAINYVEGVPRLRALADHWRKLGRDICSTEDLILCYYSSFRVLRLPADSQLSRMREQVSQLRQSIENCCQKACESKRRTRMQTNAEELGRYLQSGFDHFTSHLDLPFDFMQVSLAQNPTIHDFGDHILHLCLTIQRLYVQDHDKTRRTLEQMGSFVASCVLLACVRYPTGRLETLSIPYVNMFERAVGDYLGLHVTCGYTGPGGARRCQMVESRHGVKGHQDQRGIIAVGDFIPPFGLAFAGQWNQHLKQAISQLQMDFCYRREQADSSISDQTVAWDLHLESVNDFYGNMQVPATKLRSHATCLCCLTDVPQYPLPCGHVLCERCARAFGTEYELSLTLDRCPMHRTDAPWEERATFNLKSQEAGVCTLSLDSGGVRGIVQLETLRAIEQALGGHVPVHRFFDLIVGAGSGGLVAMSLATKGRSITNCIDLFLATYDCAYAVDNGSTSLLARLSQVVKDKRRARTSGLHDALKTAFTDHRGLFGEADQFSPDARVAVTLASEVNCQQSIVANYRRSGSDDAGYRLLTTNDPEAGPRIWQAVGAAMADVHNFKPVEIGGQKFTSDGPFGNNPASKVSKEVLRMWPSAHRSMVCLSLGTGQNKQRTTMKLLGETIKVSAISRDECSATRVANIKPYLLGRQRATETDDSLLAERMWREFKVENTTTQPHARGNGFIRLNPNIGVDQEPPRGGDYNSIRQLQTLTRDTLNQTEEQEVLGRIGNRLVATSFYLRTGRTFKTEKGTLMINGEIACRFESDKEVVKGLGRILRSQFSRDFEPYFEVRPVADSAEISTRVAMTIDRATRMIHYGIFERPSVMICLGNSIEKPSSIQLIFAPSLGHLAHGYPLGGLPRVLLGDQQSLLQSPSHRNASSLTEQMLQHDGEKTSGMSISPLTHPSTRSSISQSGSYPRFSGFDDSPPDHWLGSERYPPQSSTSCSTTDHTISQEPSVWGEEMGNAERDVALFPQRLDVQLSGLERGREHSVLLPPPVTLSGRPLGQISRVNPRYANPEYRRVVAAIQSLGSDGTNGLTPDDPACGPIQAWPRREDAMLTSLSYSRSKTPETKAPEVCTPPMSHMHI